jgi:hypothetical protein
MNAKTIFVESFVSNGKLAFDNDATVEFVRARIAELNAHVIHSGISDNGASSKTKRTVRVVAGFELDEEVKRRAVEIEADAPFCSEVSECCETVINAIRLGPQVTPRIIEIDVGKGVSLGVEILDAQKLKTRIVVKTSKGTAVLTGDAMHLTNFKANLLSLVTS